ncbi:MAG: hypothetical protein JXR76_03520, partial [Deltaproteobacteria bacterium]|nr:hypothetical protein [Deltaproteobacteria bacterium]
LEAGKINDIASGKDDSLFVPARRCTAQLSNSEMATTIKDCPEGIVLFGPGKKNYNRNTVSVSTEVHGDSGPFILANEESLFLIGNIFGKAILGFQTSSEHIIGVDNVYSSFCGSIQTTIEEINRNVRCRAVRCIDTHRPTGRGWWHRWP